MLRRRGLSGFFKFGVKGPSDTKYTDSTSLVFPYGIEKNITIWELGTVVGNNVGYATFTEDGEQKTYYKLGGRGEGKENVAILSFTTYKKQNVVIKIKDICDNENDFLAVCHLDATDKDHIYDKISGNSSKIVTFTNVAVGSHFVKIYYYQHNDSDNVYPSTPAHGSKHEGYFRLEPWTHTYEYGYDKPTPQTVKIKSYYGWYLVSKPEWLSLNMEYYKSGSNSLVITLNGNHSIARTGSIVLRERKKNTDVTINITQEANNNPNDILLSYEGGGTTADGNSVTNIKVKVKGDTTYSVTNPNNTEYSISYSAPVAITDEQSGDGAYADMSVRESTLTITKKKTGNVNPVTFRITSSPSNIYKDIIINSDKISCYCDCNQYNRCQCEIEQFNYKQEFSGCASHSYNCSAHNANASNCNSHCSANENYTKCSGHSACVCNTDKCKYTACKCENEDNCPVQNCNCNGKTCDKTTCSCNTNNPCSGECPSNGSRNRELKTCKPENDCYSHTCVNCNGKNCGCYTGDCQVDCISERNSTYYSDVDFNIQFKYSGTSQPFYMPYINFTFLYKGLIQTIVYRSVDYQVNNGQYRVMSLPYIALYENTSTTTKTKLISIEGWATNAPTGTADGRIKFTANNIDVYKTSTGVLDEKITIGATGHGLYSSMGKYLLVNLTWGSSYTGSPYSTCTCDNDLKVCYSDTCVNCGSKTVTYSECNSHCPGECGPNSTCNCHGYSCACHSEKYKTCICDGQCKGVGCNCNEESPCPGFSCNCNVKECDKTSCKCVTACQCDVKRTDCTCNTKLYYPYCDCETKCECYNYNIPTICQSHNCKTDEINGCNCNSQVTCSAKSIY